MFFQIGDVVIDAIQRMARLLNETVVRLLTLFGDNALEV